MVERVPSRREARVKGKRGGRRPGSGRRLGSVNETKKVARAVARRTGSGRLPDELLKTWADTGVMEYVDERGRRYTVQLEPADRISCAKGSAAYYKAPYQSRPAPGEQPPVVKLELDERVLAAMAAKAPDKLDVLRDVLLAIQAGGADLTRMAESSGGKGDASRYAKMLTETSDVAGRG